MIIFLYGPDSYRSRLKLTELKNKFLREVDSSGNSLTVIDAENSSFDSISQAIGTSSLFSKKRMIVIEKIFKNKSKEISEKMLAYLSGRKDSADENIIIFWDETASDYKGGKLFAFLSKQKFAIFFKALSNTETTHWIKTEVEARGGKISQAAAVILSGMFSGNLWQLNHEINKLINYKLGTQMPIAQTDRLIEITPEDVEKFAHGNFEENIFALTDAIGADNKKMTLELIEKMIDSGTAETYMLHMIIRQFKTLIQVKEADALQHSPRKIMSELKLHPYVAQKNITQAKNFTMPALKKIFSSLINIDHKLKTGQNDLKTAFDLLFVKI